MRRLKDHECRTAMCVLTRVLAEVHALCERRDVLHEQLTGMCPFRILSSFPTLKDGRDSSPSPASALRDMLCSPCRSVLQHGTRMAYQALPQR